jgi:hypothetical protein
MCSLISLFAICISSQSGRKVRQFQSRIRSLPHALSRRPGSPAVGQGVAPGSTLHHFQICTKRRRPLRTILVNYCLFTATPTLGRLCIRRRHLVLTLRVCSLGIILGPVLLRMHAAFQVHTKLAFVRRSGTATTFLPQKPSIHLHLPGRAVPS